MRAKFVFTREAEWSMLLASPLVWRPRMSSNVRMLSSRRPWWVGALVMAVMLVLAPEAGAAWYFDAPGMIWRLSGSPSSRTISQRPGVGDLDGDGHVDVVVTGTYATLGLYHGRGDGSFEPPYTIPCESGAAFADVADFDGDGNSDIAHSNLGSMGVQFGDGTGHGWTDVRFEFNDGTHAPTWLFTGDFDEDGLPDIALPCHRRFELFLSRPGRTFARSTIAADSLSLHVYTGRTADLDGDGHLDIVAECEYGAVLLYGNGDGTFEIRFVHDTHGGSLDLEVADVTGDGRLDLLVVTSAVIILPGLPGRSFGAPIVYWSEDYYSHSIEVRDVTGDGVPDLLTSPGSPRVGITVHPGLGGAAFGPPRVSQLDLGLWPLTLTDLDEDERADVVGLLEGDPYDPSALVVALGDGTGGFGTRTPIGNGSTHSPLARDIDRDGRPDLIALRYTSQGDMPVVWLNGPGRSFHEPVASPLAAHPGLADLIGAEDVTSDSIPDIVLVVEPSSAVVHAGLGDGTFGGVVETALSADGSDFHLLDVTSDGRLDLVATGWNSFRVYPGAGDGTFASAIEAPELAGAWAYDFGDLDGDGIPDVVVARPGPFGPYGNALFDLGVAHGLGDGRFGARSLVASIDSYGLYGVSVVDLDRDGRLDIATFDLMPSYNGGDCEPWCGRVQTFRQLEDGSLVARATTPWPTRSGWLHASACDLDGDGVTDLLTGLVIGPGFARGDGAGHFVQSGGWRGGLQYNLAPAVADFDGDGRLDVAEPGNDEAFLLLWGRDPVPPAVALLGPGALPALVPGAPATVRWSASDDVGVASIDLFVSRHGPRGPFERVALGLGDTGEHTWTVTGPLSDSVAFKVVARDSAGNVAHAVSAERLRIVDAAAVDAIALPTRLAITSVAPNPLRSRLTTRFALPRAGRVTLALHDLQGRRVATLLDGTREAGSHAIDWAPREAVRPGLYFLRLTAGREHTVARVIVAR